MVERVKDIFDKFMELAVPSECDRKVREELKKIAEEQKKVWEQQNANPALHLVFGGRVNSGKTTLLNSLLANGLKDFPEGLELLHSYHRENTDMSTILRLGVKRVEWQQETASILQGRAGMAERGPVHICKDVQELQRQLVRIQQILRASEAPVRRLVLGLPFQLADQGPSASNFTSWFSELWPQRRSDEEASLILVDTPGIGSTGAGGGLKNVRVETHLLSIIEQYQYVYCHVVDLNMDVSDMTGSMFDVLKEMVGSGRPMCLVIVFTKLERFRRRFDDEEFVANLEDEGDDYDKLLARKLRRLCERLKEAGIRHRPYSGAVNGLRALRPMEPKKTHMESQEILLGDGAVWQEVEIIDEDDPERAEKMNARFEVRILLDGLCGLGTALSGPLQIYNLLAPLETNTREVIRRLMREKGVEINQLFDDGDHALVEAIISAEKRFAELVKLYFANIKWTAEGVRDFRPPECIPAEECAINKLLDTFEVYFEEEKQRLDMEYPNGKMGYRDVVARVSNQILELALYQINKDMLRLEEEAMKDFNKAFSEVLKGALDLKRGAAEYLLPLGIGGGAGLLAGGGAYLSSWGVLAAVGGPQAWAIGALAFVTVAAITKGVDYMNDQRWTWEQVTAEVQSTVLTQLRDGTPQITKSLEDSFSNKADALKNKLADFGRIVCGESDILALDLLRLLQVERSKAEQKVEKVLGDGHWLVGDQELRDKWEEVSKEMFG